MFIKIPKLSNEEMSDRPWCFICKYLTYTSTTTLIKGYNISSTFWYVNKDVIHICTHPNSSSWGFFLQTRIWGNCVPSKVISFMKRIHNHYMYDPQKKLRRKVSIWWVFDHISYLLWSVHQYPSPQNCRLGDIVVLWWEFFLIWKGFKI